MCAEKKKEEKKRRNLGKIWALKYGERESLSKKRMERFVQVWLPVLPMDVVVVMTGGARDNETNGSDDYDRDDDDGNY